MITPTEAYAHVFFKAGRVDSPPIPNAKQSVNEVMKIEPPACSMVYPINSMRAILS